MNGRFFNDLSAAVAQADVLFFCTGHAFYKESLERILELAPRASAVVDGANLYSFSDAESRRIAYAGIGRGRKAAPAGFTSFVEASFRAMERGVANEVLSLVDFLNDRYAATDFNKVSLDVLRRLSATCVTGCEIAQTGEVGEAPSFDGFATRLAVCAAGRPACGRLDGHSGGSVDRGTRKGG